MAPPAHNSTVAERRPRLEVLAPVSPASPTMDFDNFYRSEFSSMVGLARTICGNHEVAEDLAQEAMSRAHNNWAKIREYEKPGAWLRRVTINLAISRRRRVLREMSTLRRSALEQPDTSAEEDRGDEDVWAAVRQLPPRQRAAIALFYQEDLSTRDIADALNCTVSTATSHLSQARARLAKLLDEPFPERGSDES